MAKDIELDAMKLCRKINVVVHVNNVNLMLVRTWFAIRLIKLATLIGGFGWGGIEEITDG